MTRIGFIERHSDKFCYTPHDKKVNVSDDLLVETILNYGTLDDYRELVSVLTAQRVAEVFFGASERQKQNYYPEIYHFFSLVLAPYKTNV